MSRTAQMIGGLLSVVLVAYLVVMVLMVVLEPRLLFRPPSLERDALRALAQDWKATEITLRAADGTPLYGWRLGRGPQLAILFSGNGGSVGRQDVRYRSLLDAGFAILHVNYRGYPGSGGAPSEAGLLEDAMAAWEEGLKSHLPGDIVIFGQSLGGGVALGLGEILSQLPPGQRPTAILVESSFVSAWRVGAEQYPWLPVRLLMRNRFESERRAPLIQIPVVVVHGADDSTIPPAHGRALAAALPEAVHVEVPGGHNDVLWHHPKAKAALDRVIGH